MTTKGGPPDAGSCADTVADAGAGTGTDAAHRFSCSWITNKLKLLYINIKKNILKKKNYIAYNLDVNCIQVLKWRLWLC